MHPSEKLIHDLTRSGQDRETMRALGAQASAFTKRLLADQRVDLESDVRVRDRNGRLLAYVWRQDGALFNLTLLRDGYAQVYTVAPNVRYATAFLACQREARAAQTRTVGAMTDVHRPGARDGALPRRRRAGRVQ